MEYKKAEAQLDELLIAEKIQQEGLSEEEDDSATERSFSKPKVKHKNTLILNLNAGKHQATEEQESIFEGEEGSRGSIISRLKEQIIDFLELETHKIRRSKDDPLFNQFTLEVLRLTKKLLEFGLIRAG